MKKRNECPVCGSDNAKKCWALVAPFLRSYALDSEAQRTAQLRECRCCGHRYFREEPSTEELQRLYQAYRGEQYLKTRQKWEPWYTRRLNEATLASDFAATRQQSLRKLLRQAGWGEGERRLIVDVGGDRGQFIPLDFSDGAYVLDSSRVEPANGVTRVDNLAELPGKAGLVICLHVLEHLPDPVGLLKELVNSGMLAPGCLVLLEVPLERPWLGPLMGKSFYRNWLELISRWSWPLIGLDFLATAARVKLGVVAPPLFLKLHEHVQFFSKKSLSRSIEAAGLTIQREDYIRTKTSKRHQQALTLIAIFPGKTY